MSAFYSQNTNFQGRLPPPVEISGKKNRGNVGNLAQFAQNERKNHQMLKNDDFWPFWKYSQFWKFSIHKSKFSKSSPELQKFLHHSKLSEQSKMHIENLFKTSAWLFWPVLTLGGSESKILSKIWVPKTPSMSEISDNLGVSGHSTEISETFLKNPWLGVYPPQKLFPNSK